MEKEFIPYEQALALKELGFESPYPIGGYQEGSIFYYEKGKLRYDGQPMYSSNYHDGQILAPLYQQAFRWFREKYKLEGTVNLNDSTEGKYHYYFNYVNTNNINNRREHCDFFIGNFRTYEEAELECLKKLIEILKNK